MTPSKIGPEWDRQWRRFDERYDKILRAMLEPAPAGEYPMPDIREFTEKRSQLQEGMSKEAGPLKDFIGRAAASARKMISGGSTRRTIGRGVTQTVEHAGLIGPKGLLIGGSLLGIGALGEPVLSAAGQKIRKAIYPSITDRVKADEEAVTSFSKEVGKRVGEKTVNLFADMLSKTVQAPVNAFQRQAQRSVFETLKTEDDVLAQADPQQLLETFHTMVRFAPTLATDKNAVKTFLRESALYGTGPNFVGIKQLADAESAVTGAKERK